jgi:hypothetical protein
MLADMPVSSRCPTSDQTPTTVPGSRVAAWWPWSYRVAGATSSWPAVELYEAESLLDVVTSTRLTARVLRGGRAVRSASGERVFAWGRLPLRGGIPAVDFSRGRFRGATVEVPPIRVTSWCWLAIADGRYDRVAVRHDAIVARRRLRVARPPC